MQLGWSDLNAGCDATIPKSRLQQTIEDADRLGYKYLHLPTPNFAAPETLPTPKSVNLVMPLAAFEGDSARTAVTRIRRTYDRLEGKLALKLCARGNRTLRTSFQILETLLSETSQVPKTVGLSLPEPQPEVLVVGQDGSAESISNAAAHGFRILSPEWQATNELARHWPRIVAGSTHAAMRACPGHWHVARSVFVSENTEKISSLRANIAKCANHKGTLDYLIAGSGGAVVKQLRHLRERIGPFGVLHCVHLGMDTRESARQREILATEVLPTLVKPTEQPQREFEQQ